MEGNTITLHLQKRSDKALHPHQVAAQETIVCTAVISTDWKILMEGMEMEARGDLVDQTISITREVRMTLIMEDGESLYS